MSCEPDDVLQAISMLFVLPHANRSISCTSHVWHVGLSLSIGASIDGHASNEKSCVLKHEISRGIAISMGKTQNCIVSDWILPLDVRKFLWWVIILIFKIYELEKWNTCRILQASLYFWCKKTCSCRLRVS